MLSESKKQNPKPAAGEHRVISRLKAAEEASKKIQAESESVVPEVAGVSQHQHTQGIAFKPAAEDFYPALGEQKEPSEGNGESSDSEAEEQRLLQRAFRMKLAKSLKKILRKKKILHNQLSFLAHLKLILPLFVHLKIGNSGFTRASA
jgi:hypothetical protein